MPDILTCILIALVFAVVVLLIILLLRSGKDNGISQLVRDEFSHSRTEAAAEQRNRREELVYALEAMGKRLAAVEESERELGSEVSKSLDEIRVSSLEQNRKQLQYVVGMMERMQADNEKRLEQMRETVDEKLNVTLRTRLDSSFRSVSEQLEKVYVSLGEMKTLSSGVTENVTSLNRILTNVKARGTWAEIQLDGILAQTIPGMYNRNVHTLPDSREVVEFAVRIPSAGEADSFAYLPIDSKFPLEDYVRLCSAADAGDAQAAAEYRKALERRVYGFARDIAKYINEPVTTPFAIMYLATEGLYNEITGSGSGIAERIQNEFSVMIAGPSTVTALLNSLAMGFRAVAVNEKAKEIRALLAAAKAQYDKFGDTLEKARRKIEEAGKSLDEAQSRNSIIQKKLKSVELTNDENAGEILGIEE